MEDHDLIGRLNEVLALDGPGGTDQHDQQGEKEPHETHNVQEGVCTKCMMRTTWPGVTLPCPTLRPLKSRVPIDHVALEMIKRWAAFRAWWEDQGHVKELHSLDEWIAEMIEWRRMTK